MAKGRDRPDGGPRTEGTVPVTIDPREIEQAYVRGALKSRKMNKALDTIVREMERDPESLARVLRRWMDQD